MPGHNVHQRPGAFTGAALALLIMVRPAAGANLSVLSLPEAVTADNATETAVLCAIADGYPNNLYAVKGTFSPGILPYYGLTFNPGSTLWASQLDAWTTAQRRIQTDGQGAWRGYLFMRLEETAPRGAMLFRFSAVPLSPISLPGPTVSDWHPVASLDANTTAGWLCGHVYRDAACTVSAAGVIVQAVDEFGRLLGAYSSQNSYVLDGEDPADAGFIRLGIPIGTVSALTGRTRTAGPDGPAGTAVPLFVRGAGPWRVRAGQAVSLDASVWGDADGDGALTLADAAEALRSCAGIASMQGGVPRADVWPDDPDGLVTLEDSARLLRRLAGNG